MADLEAEINALDAENEELLQYVEQLEEELTTAGANLYPDEYPCDSIFPNR